MFWNATERSELEGTYTLDKLIAEEKSLKEIFDRVSPILQVHYLQNFVECLGTNVKSNIRNDILVFKQQFSMQFVTKNLFGQVWFQWPFDILQALNLIIKKYPDILLPSIFTLKEMMWAWGIVLYRQVLFVFLLLCSSRSLFIQFSNFESLCLVPFVDLLNHKSPANVSQQLLF